MSAIYGAVGLNSEKQQRLSEQWKQYYDEYRIDKNVQILTESAFFGCGIQFFTQEAKSEVLPIWDEERELLFTADCVLDNREELIRELNVSTDTPDGRLLYAAYLHWGKQCAEHLRGPFSYVVYDRKKGEVVLGVDQFAQRCLFYHVEQGALYFSTLLFPILKKADLALVENERWLIDTASIRGPMIVTEPQETAVKNVYKVVSGTYVTIDLQHCKEGEPGEENRYYDPRNTISTDTSISLARSEELVREVMRGVVKGILRENIEVATQLSSGLDSSTVACLAAPLLQEKGQKLYSFTSVPMKQAGIENKGYFVGNETEGVMKIVEAYPNIEPTFVATEDRNYLLEAQDIVALWELPCKSQQNAIWVDEIYRQIVDKGCRIMLNGGTGNCTISAGSIESTMLDAAKHLQLGKAFRMLNSVRMVGASRKKYLKSLAKLYKNYYGWYLHEEERDCYRYILTRKELGESYRLTKRFHKELYHMKPIKSMECMREEMYMVNANAQIGEVDTKNSLKYGVLPRDPMRSVELVNLCFSLPMECFASSDYDRRLVRVGMEGVVPEAVRHDVIHRGRQSADNLFRAGLVWEEFREKISTELQKNQKLQKYLDTEAAAKILSELTAENVEENYANVQLLIDVYSFALYLHHFE